MSFFMLPGARVRWDHVLLCSQRDRDGWCLEPATELLAIDGEAPDPRCANHPAKASVDTLKLAEPDLLYVILGL
jgi:hypothetical protein